VTELNRSMLSLSYLVLPLTGPAALNGGSAPGRNFGSAGGRGCRAQYLTAGAGSLKR